MVVHENWKSNDALWSVHMNLSHSKEIGELMKKAVVGNMDDDFFYIKELDEE